MIGRTGIKVVFIAFIAWVSCVIGSIYPLLIGGAVLYLERDEWLRKQIVSMLTLYVILCLAGTFVTGYLFEFVGQFIKS